LVDAPDWFRRALAHKPDEAQVEVEGCPIHYLRWGDRAKPGIVLVHGARRTRTGGASSRRC